MGSSRTRGIQGGGATPRARSLRGFVVGCCLLALAGTALAACGSSDQKVNPARLRTALAGRVEDELGDDVRLLSQRSRPTALAPGWERVMPGVWFHPQKGFVPTMFLVEKPVTPTTTAQDVLDGGRQHDAESTDNFRSEQTARGKVLGGVPGIAYVNSYDSDGSRLRVTGEMAVVGGRLYNAYVTATAASTRDHGLQYRHMLDSVHLVPPA